MRAHVTVHRWRYHHQDLPWVACCECRRCPGWSVGFSNHLTHAEALAAAWAHIKEHS